MYAIILKIKNVKHETEIIIIVVVGYIVQHKSQDHIFPFILFPAAKLV